MQLPASVRRCDPAADYPVLEIDHPECRARVALHGGHVMEWRPTGACAPVLYLSPEAVFREGKAIRGGIPICWPWFNAHPTDPTLPAHGIARNRFWTLDRADEDAAAVTLVLSMSESPWRAVLTIRLGRALEVALESWNTGTGAIPLSGALHSYLRVGDITKIRVEGLDQRPYLDTVGGRETRRQDGSLTIDREVDRIYDYDPTTILVDESLDRRLVVEKSGSPSTVVWNPWIEKAAALGDLPDDGYRHFVCIEAAIANESAVLIAPGARHVLSTRISIADQGENR